MDWFLWLLPQYQSYKAARATITTVLILLIVLFVCLLYFSKYFMIGLVICVVLQIINQNLNFDV
jgi:hypothetical protein